ncbi:DEAD/DEAH box helicase family protein [Methanosphaera sp. BMS]|uniref:DEAD/DEAH box helicase family protein n=1 Tax=Methanosphaera sp. BMS TaxID=1789762 RepID=UPI000DC1D7C0|nr:DEAD/DEAH box helicase family protein [Methanosphaera sp. BMS]AWX31843.1 hypothetical protein AW729_01495 [Methanosphaera sp. BMS]
MENSVEVTCYGTINKIKGKNLRPSYQHQIEAKQSLDKMNEHDSFSTLLVLPTGGGKTYTAATWIMRNAINKHKKVIWIAHRQMLIEQALETFKDYPYEEYLPNISSFNFRIISGNKNHDRMVNIQENDDILLISKDSAGKNLEKLNQWIENESEVYLIIDEAHHSTARTYQRIIEYFKDNVTNVKLIGLTATPMRTAKREQALLSQIFCDGIDEDTGLVVMGKDVEDNEKKKGICYRIPLKDLMKNEILSTPIRESTDTNLDIPTLSPDELKKINNSDKLPKELIDKMNNDGTRNRVIVDKYLENRSKYGQTIVFAMSQNHAIGLNAVFQKNGVKSNYIISSVQNDMGYKIDQERNERIINQFKNNELEVLINVNILTEGADIPQTKTVFLTRPTTSIIRMTQMVGRALRGVKAGGTKEAYIISFVDKWEDKVAWVTPELIFNDVDVLPEDPKASKPCQMSIIAISKIEEFAKILDDSIDTSKLDAVPFEKRIPIGMYSFSYDKEEGTDYSYQVMVYDSTCTSYAQFLESLDNKEIFEEFGIEDEYLKEEDLKVMADYVKEKFFNEDMIPPYDENDICEILNYFASQKLTPEFYTFDEIDRNNLDVSKIAEKMIQEKYDPIQQMEYIEEQWDLTDINILNIFYSNNFDLFVTLIQHEIFKQLKSPKKVHNIIYGTKKYEELTLYELSKFAPNEAEKLKEKIFEDAKDKNGKYTCHQCGINSKYKAGFEIDHIIPMNEGGLTTEDNLQLLCRGCNRLKGDKID